mgnify:CR=1 FL=1
MEDLNKYMEKPVSSLTAIRAMVQSNVDRKEEYLKLEPLVILTAIELEDNKKMTNAYHDVIERNDEALNFIIDVKNDIFKIKIIREQIDRNTQIGIQQIKQIDYYINMLNDILNMLNDERSKLDRVVRYYEKTFSYFKDF